MSGVSLNWPAECSFRDQHRYFGGALVAVEVAIEKFVAEFPNVTFADRFAALCATGAGLGFASLTRMQRIIGLLRGHYAGIDDVKDAMQLRALLTVSSKEPPPVS